MNYQHRVLSLQSFEQYGKRIPMEICGDVMRRVVPLMSYSVRMAIEGCSALRGPKPAWLSAASDIRFVDYSAENGDTLLHLEVPALGDAAPEIFEQPALWDLRPRPDSTAADLFADVVGEVRSSNPESTFYDRTLLARFKPLGRLFSTNLKSFHFRESPRRDVMSVDETVVRNAEQLSTRTPAPQEVRIVGLLDMVRHSTRSFGLKMKDGCEVRGVLDAQDQMDSVKHFVGTQVLVLGKAVYRPSGNLLRIDARAIEASEGQAEIWARVPPARPSRSAPLRTKPVNQERTGVGAFFGTWPGAETEAELLAELQEIRG